MLPLVSSGPLLGLLTNYSSLLQVSALVTSFRKPPDFLGLGLGPVVNVSFLSLCPSLQQHLGKGSSWE